jgi:hypothetical protein
MVRKGGLEPPPLAGPDPKSGASANSATFALACNSFYQKALIDVCGFLRRLLFPVGFSFSLSCVFGLDKFIDGFLHVAGG